MTPIASLSLQAIDAQGHQFTLEVELGSTTYDVGFDAWGCPLAIRPLHKTRTCYGEDSLQALCLTLRLAQVLLQDFVDKGGRLFMGHEPFPFEAYFPKSVDLQPQATEPQ